MTAVANAILSKSYRETTQWKPRLQMKDPSLCFSSLLVTIVPVPFHGHGAFRNHSQGFTVIF